MPYCIECDQKMADAIGCPVENYLFHGHLYPRIRYGYEPVWLEQTRSAPVVCPGCRVLIGHYHHPGCEQECCPKCRTQAVNCLCETLHV